MPVPVARNIALSGRTMPPETRRRSHGMTETNQRPIW